MSFGSGISWSYTGHRQGFWPRINCSQMKLPDFESPSSDSSSKSANFGLSKWIFYIKNHPNLSEFFFSWKNSKFCAHFLLRWFFYNFKFKKVLFLKLLQILEKVAKLGKSNQDAHNPGKWLILQALLKNWVAEGVASDSHDTTQQAVSLLISTYLNKLLKKGFQFLYWSFIIIWA